MIGRIKSGSSFLRILGVAAGMFVGVTLSGATLGWADGVNLQPSYFKGGEVNLGWELMAKYAAIKTVRIEIEPSVPLVTVKRWLREAHAHGYTVIATYHFFPANGSDDVQELMKAARWWQANFAALREEGPFVINLMNEWGSHRQTALTYSAAYNDALALVRAVYDGPIIVDVPGWGQETYVARDASRLLADKNLVFSVHLYGGAWVQQGPNRWMKKQDLDVLTDCGRPILVGEYGAARKGGADWSALVDHARAKGWTLLAWAWNGDGEGMNMVRPLWADNGDARTFFESSYFRKVYRKLRLPPGEKGASPPP